MKAGSSYFSNFIMCTPISACARANSTLNFAYLQKLPQTNAKALKDWGEVGKYNRAL